MKSAFSPGSIRLMRVCRFWRIKPSVEPLKQSQSGSVLSPRSGRHAFRFRLAELGYHLPDEAFGRAWEQFLNLADRKKDILDRDLADIVNSVDTQSLEVPA